MASAKSFGYQHYPKPHKSEVFTQASVQDYYALHSLRRTGITHLVQAFMLETVKKSARILINFATLFLTICFYSKVVSRMCSAYLFLLINFLVIIVFPSFHFIFQLITTGNGVFIIEEFHSYSSQNYFQLYSCWQNITVVQSSAINYRKIE